MALPSLYLETTIPSYLTARRSGSLRLAADQQTTEIWWETRRLEYELYTSTTVADEIGRGEKAMAEARLAMIARVPRLPFIPEAIELAEHLLMTGVIPPKAAADATHLALCAAHGIEFLLTWNCTHINNPHLIRRIERACMERSLGCPVVCTPEELLPI